MVKERTVYQGSWSSRREKKGLIWTSTHWDGENIWGEKFGGDLDSEFARQVVEKQCVEVHGSGDTVLMFGTGHSKGGEEIIGFDSRRMSGSMSMYFDGAGRRKTLDEIHRGLPDTK
jgi:hypothetical protein